MVQEVTDGYINIPTIKVVTGCLANVCIGYKHELMQNHPHYHGIDVETLCMLPIHSAFSVTRALTFLIYL